MTTVRVPAVTTIPALLDAAAARDPDRLALVAPDASLSYGSLAVEADAAAAALQQLGVRPGDRVAASLPNSASLVVAFHGTMRLGAVWVGVNRTLAAPEKLALLRHARPVVFLCEEAVAAELAQATGGSSPGPAVVPVGGSTQDGTEWQALLAASHGSHARRPAIDPFAPAGIAYTSGTTGSPKGVVHSQHNLVVPGAAIVASRRYGRDLRKGDCLSLNILNLLVLSTLLATQAGGCSIVSDARSAVELGRWLRENEVTVWNGVPTMLYDLVHDSRVVPEDLASLEEVWTGGARCPEGVRRDFEEKFGVPLRGTYGLTEAPTIVTIEARDVPHVEGASGVALPHLEVTVRDGDDRVLPAGEVGEICVGGRTAGPWAGAYRTMLGYWEQGGGVQGGPADGLLRTGDLGSLDGAGNLFVRDRKQLLIIRGGANVYPAEVEQVLELHPAVAGSAVVGVPDERLGERVAAVVELATGAEADADELRAWCARHLARYKVPDWVRVVASLPRNAMGKVVRQELPRLLGPLEPPSPAATGTTARGSGRT